MVVRRVINTTVALLAVVAVAWVGLFVVGLAVPGRSYSGGCNHIPIVNDKPAYSCTNQPPH